jgi:hypothetical protein
MPQDWPGNETGAPRQRPTNNGRSHGMIIIFVAVFVFSILLRYPHHSILCEQCTLRGFYCFVLHFFSCCILWFIYPRGPRRKGEAHLWLNWKLFRILSSCNMRCIKNNTINCGNFNTLHDGKFPEVNKITCDTPSSELSTISVAHTAVSSTSLYFLSLIPSIWLHGKAN